MLYTVLSKKDILKQNKELLELHKRCVTDYLIQRSLKLSLRKKFFRIYDYYIDEHNITEYFFRPINVFVYALITNKLGSIQDYFKSDLNKSKKRKKNARK